MKYPKSIDFILLFLQKERNNVFTAHHSSHKEWLSINLIINILTTFSIYNQTFSIYHVNLVVTKSEIHSILLSQNKGYGNYQ